MCLAFDDLYVKKTVQLKKRQKTMRCYKMFEVLLVSAKIVTPFHSKDIILTDKSEFVSDRESIELTSSELYALSVNQGIHVYTSKEMAEVQIKFFGLPNFFIPVTCKTEDLMVLGDCSCAVFTKIKINKKLLISAGKKAARNYNKKYRSYYNVSNVGI